ncbi:hypothetical protein MAA5396_02712 [Marinovum algicola]|uniref:Uncharacterized protein n=1 Tax=Marinovum algicola TaxID=42444 RepID=A0A975ZNR1_9RHOB|nr:hypothetical protein SAMN04487940_10849 [Marinovum algicola]SLN52564.1 hypothetical protein MAA5396_02712 [Marinovum algicola]
MLLEELPHPVTNMLATMLLDIVTDRESGAHRLRPFIRCRLREC